MPDYQFSIQTYPKEHLRRGDYALIRLRGVFGSWYFTIRRLERITKDLYIFGTAPGHIVSVPTHQVYCKVSGLVEMHKSDVTEERILHAVETGETLTFIRRNLGHFIKKRYDRQDGVGIKEI